MMLPIKKITLEQIRADKRAAVENFVEKFTSKLKDEITDKLIQGCDSKGLSALINYTLPLRRIRKWAKKDFLINKLSKTEILEGIEKGFEKLLTELEEGQFSANVSKDWLGRYIITVKIPGEPIKVLTNRINNIIK